MPLPIYKHLEKEDLEKAATVLSDTFVSFLNKL